MENKKGIVKTICDTVVFGGYLVFLYKIFRRII